MSPTPSGLVMLRQGFARTPEADASFALGYPYIRPLVDGARGDEVPHATARMLLLKPDLPLRMEWPRRVAQGLVRVWGRNTIYEIGPNQRELRLEAEEALWKQPPIGVDEANQLVETRVSREVPGLTERAVANFVLFLEGMVGSEAVAEAVVGNLEALEPDALLSEWALPPVVTYTLGFVLLRVPGPSAERLRDRLRGCLERCFEHRPVLARKGFAGFGSSHARSVHLLLNGGAAAEDTDRTLRWYAHVTDDPVLVRMRVALNRLAYVPDARLVFLGGPDVLERYGKDWRKLNREEDQRWFFRTHAMIRGPEATGILLDMALDSMIPADVHAWFDEHRALVEEELREVASGASPRAVTCRKILKRWAGEADPA